MFLYGSNQRSAKANYRPALHDANGLAIHTGSDEHIWRPLNNPQNLAVSTFQVENPKGFGLLQRGRDFAQYEDLDDHYEERPSVWIEPKGEWGKGKVELVEIPTPDETNDNIVAFWTPDEQPKPGRADAVRLPHALDQGRTRPAGQGHRLGQADHAQRR